MNLDRMKELTLQIKELEKELDLEKTKVLEGFRGMTEEDLALTDNKMSGNGIIVQYYPESASRRVNTTKLKEDGLYDKYSTEVKKSDYIRVNV